MSRFKNYRHAWLLVTLLALAPLWIIGLFDRGYWTPDEPREADIAWRMSQQTDRTLPQLADAHFLEKPPLTYWLSAAALHVFGDTPAAARAPNLIYALVTVLAIGALVFSIAGASAACIAAIVAGSGFTGYQVAIWLAPDACLVAGCALALLGLYRGYVAERSNAKLAWYTLMHLGALIGFMAKSGPGWIFPALTLLVLVAWERRWHELFRWQLWAGLALQLIAIGAWVSAVWHQPDGATDLRILFWNNLAGRFTDIHASGALDYASGHKNWFGKYFVELPYYLFPWTLLVVAALLRAWHATQIKSTEGTAWRFAIAACLPFLLLLSLATTARSIYIAPALLGFAILVGIWSKELAGNATRATAWAVRGTRYATGLMACLMITALCVMAAAEWHTSARLGLITTAVVVLTIAATAVLLSAKTQRQHRPYWSLAWAYVVFGISITVGGSALFPLFDRWQDLGALAQEIDRDSTGHSLALLQPDETTIAMMDHQLHQSTAIVQGNENEAKQLALQWFSSHPGNGLILVNLPGHASGNLTQLVAHLRTQKSSNDGLLAELEQANVARLVARYELPQGRRYALISSTNMPIYPAGLSDASSATNAK